MKRVISLVLALVMLLSVGTALAQPATMMDRVAQQWRYIQDVIVDPRSGSEWYWSTEEDGTPTKKPIVEEWKCPYHNGRMCLRLIEKA